MSSSGQVAPASRPVKYNFDTVFGANGVPAAAAPRVRSSYAAEEVESIRRDAFAQGKAGAEAQHAETLGAVGSAILRLIGAVDAHLPTMRRESAAVALLVGRKLAGAALNAFPLIEVESLVADCLHKLHRESRIVVRVSPACAEGLRADIDSLCAKHGYTGRVIVLAEPSLTDADCRVEWADGGVESDLTATFAAIEQSAERWRANPIEES